MENIPDNGENGQRNHRSLRITILERDSSKTRVTLRIV